MNMTRKLILALATVALTALFVPTAAFANFAIHGNYVNDTDACAGCHRAHTSVSTITWADAGAKNHSGLLVSSATSMYQFCYACHDTQGYSADTNVRDGVYYGTANGTNGAILNGGGFESFDNVPVTSTHVYNGTSWGAYGGGYTGAGKVGADGQIGSSTTTATQGVSEQIKMDCATCHDPHGSANYRILKSMVNGNPVGGYLPSGDPQNPTPDGFVSSVETGWPDTGFKLHTAYPAYEPNYTTPMYAKGYNQAAGTINADKGMSGWCAGCHSTYIGDSTQVFTKTDGTQYQSLASTYNAGDGGGLKLRHRHPINVPLSAYNAGDKASMIVTDLVLPLANDLSEKGTPTNTDSDWIECLTCHRAHGTAAVMTGEAASSSVQPFVSATPSALLRLDNRGVCEACHNK